MQSSSSYVSGSQRPFEVDTDNFESSIGISIRKGGKFKEPTSKTWKSCTRRRRDEIISLQERIYGRHLSFQIFARLYVIGRNFCLDIWPPGTTELLHSLMKYPFCTSYHSSTPKLTLRKKTLGNKYVFTRLVRFVELLAEYLFEMF